MDNKNTKKNGTKLIKRTKYSQQLSTISQQYKKLLCKKVHKEADKKKRYIKNVNRSNSKCQRTTGCWDSHDLVTKLLQLLQTRHVNDQIA